jgi:hypothetical protein
MTSGAGVRARNKRTTHRLACERRRQQNVSTDDILKQQIIVYLDGAKQQQSNALHDANSAENLVHSSLYAGW